MKTLISLKKLNGVTPFAQLRQVPKPTAQTNTFAATLQANLITLGYIMNQELYNYIAENVVTPATEAFATELVDTIRKIKGADVEYRPMYPNFPQQVMEASELELFLNAITHYWTFGAWMPEYEKKVRPFAVELNELREIGLKTEEDFAGVFTKLVGSNESLSEEDKAYVEWFIKTQATLQYPKNIPFKENMCVVAGLALAEGKDVDGLVKTSTDVLRVATYLSGGDVSLADNTKFKSFGRPIRRKLTMTLEGVITEEDIARHRNKWIKLFHNLHVGDYSKRVYTVAQKVRDNAKIETFNGKVEAALTNGSLTEVVGLLIQRPGDFARRLDKVLREAQPALQQVIVTGFLNVASRVDTRVLLQLIGHFQQRGEDIDTRVVFPKGSVQNAQVIGGLPALSQKTVNVLVEGLREVLRHKFEDLDPMGSVYIDPELRGCPLPTQQRSASEGTVAVARGTKMPILESANTLRFFIYWVGQDIDLSATFHGETFQNIGHVSYTNLRQPQIGVVHSGDITQAPNGAAEFIDVDTAKALAAGVRYVAMNVLVFSGPSFKDHVSCYAGWMERSSPNSNEIFDPKTVKQKIDLQCATKNVIPVVFDLKERVAIWSDISTGSAKSGFYGNNVESNRGNIVSTVKAIVATGSKVNLYELLTLHAQARGEMVASPEDADVVFSAKETPYDVNTINSEFVV